MLSVGQLLATALLQVLPLAAPLPNADTSCAALARSASSLDAGVESSVIVPAGLLPRRPAAPVDSPQAEAGPHCLVRGTIAPRTGVGGRHYGIGYELRLPLAWNGRFLFQGGGGLDGVVNPAYGVIPLSAGTAAPALARGFAVVSTDAGHQGQDAGFAADQQARLDYAYNALFRVTTAAKGLVAAFYGHPAERAYFLGCSNGGRQGMLAAQRLPDEYDGIVAGNPGFRLSRAAIAQIWDSQQLTKVAPRGPDGLPVLAQALTPADLSLLAKVILNACDAKDGLADGMINDVKACHFDPAVTQCKSGQKENCLTAAKIGAVKAVFDGAKSPDGKSIYASWPYDPGIATEGWRGWKLGHATSGPSDSRNIVLGLDSLSRFYMTPPRPGMTLDGFDFARDPALVTQTGALNDAVSTYLTSFADRGGKLLVYQGMGDPVFSANDIMGWFEQLARDTPVAVDGFARLFLAPGMNHCGGGPATDDFDPLGAIVGWVEEGKAPDRIIAHGASFPGLSRPLCPYPKVARYEGGDTNDAASFVCR